MSEARRNLGRAVLFVSIATALVALATRSGVPAAHAARASVAPASGSEPSPAAPATPAAKDPRVADLDNQIKSLRDQYHSELDPLETQVKALRDKYDPQIAALEDQRHTLVESTKSPQVRDLDDQETAELKQLADQE